MIEGSVLRAGDGVRITAQLIDARSDHHLWSESYERKLRDIHFEDLLRRIGLAAG